MTIQPHHLSFSLAAPLGAACLFLAGAAAAASDADLARCRALGDATARLACYDGLLPASATSAPLAVAPRPAPVAPVAPVAAAPTPAAPVASVPATAGFGFELRAIQSAPDALDSRITGLFEGWDPGTRIRLDNGQVWQVIDDSRAYIGQRDPKVRISRAAMGSFLFEVEGRRSVARVRRIE